MIFYITFSSTHPFGNGWLEVHAKDEMDARAKIFSHFGKHWAFLYTQESFRKSFFPKGKIGEIK